MWPLRIPFLLLPLLLACAGPAQSDAPGAQPAGAGTGRSWTEGKDYLLLQRLRVVDPSGFAQPMEAYSVLVPRGWHGQGGISWQVGNPCMTEVIRNRLTVASPDGKTALEIYPAHQWEWWDDQLMLQTQQQQQQNPVFRRCPISPPLDAAGYLRGPLAQEMGAQVLEVQPAPQMEQLLRQQAAQANAQYRQAGVSLENRPSAAMASLRYSDGSAGVALCSIGMTVAWMPNYMSGGQSASYTCQTQQAVAVRCPAGQEGQARQLLATVVGSLRINPQWQQGVQQMVSNVAAMEQRETMKRAQIQREAMNYSADLQQRTWEAGQESRDRIAEGWGQALRGVESWSDGQGGTTELHAGYNEAWQGPDGSYILSNDPLFNPNVVLQQDWKKLEKGKP
jgi:hypothetical protein